MLQDRLHAPTINKNIISRETLLTKLRHAEQSKLTLVTAPAGYGKTTAVFDWLNHWETPSAWLSLNEYNSSPSTFWKGVCFALEDVIPGIVKDTEYILATPELLHANLQINLLSDAITAFGQEFAFVLDDVHLISDVQILKGLSYFIEYMPKNLHLVIISRTEPQLELAKYRIKWQMRTIDENDLRFHKEDILRFYQARGLNLNDDEVERLDRYSEGWAASLVAVAMTMEKGMKRPLMADTLYALSGDINNYLRNDVISVWPEKKWAFAMNTSILSTLSVGVCNAVTGEKNSRQMLEALYRDNGFLTAPDAHSGEYRFHHLFRDFALKSLMQENPALLSDLHARAGFWYREHESIDMAIEHFIGAGLYEEALELIENKDIYNMYDNSVLLSWIECLPKRLRDNSFMVAYIFAKYYMDIERYDLARSWGEKMRALKTLPKYTSDPEAATFCDIACALHDTNLFLREGDTYFFPSFLLAIKQFDSRYYKMPEFYDFNIYDIYFYRCPTSHVMRLLNEERGEFEEFAVKYRTLITKNPGYKPLILGEYSYENNRLEEALPHFFEAMEEARSANCMGALVPTMANIARIRCAAGDHAGAFKALDECQALLRESGKLYWNQMVSALRCRIFIDLGDKAEVEKWLSSCRLDIYAEISRIREFEFIVYARALLFKGCVQDAELLLSRLLAFTEKAKRTHSQVEVLNLLALLHDQNRNRAKALDYLGLSLTLGKERGYIRSYLDERKAMAGVLAAYLNDRKDRLRAVDESNSDFAATLLSHLRMERPVAAVKGDLLDCLSPREREVLALLLEACTNKEIGEQMGITLQAVKYHVGNIYGKLGVKNRSQCLKLVREHPAKQA